MGPMADRISGWVQGLAASIGVDPLMLIYGIVGAITLLMFVMIVRAVLRLLMPEPVRADLPIEEKVVAAGIDSDPDEHDQPAPRLSLESPLRAKDSLLPRSGWAYLVSVIILSIGAWGIGYALASDKSRLLASAEWRWQPIYLATHFIVLRLFLNAYMLNYRLGVQHFDVDPERAVKGLRRATGWMGRAFAIAVAAPFAFLDYRYLTSGRYETLAGAGKIETADLVMWGIWSVEWLINAYIWIVVVGFALKNIWVIRRFNFRAPIETVVHAKQYRPFLRMSGQGATVLFGFAIVTGVYIALTGGELTDYLGLTLTMLLVVISFFIPFTLLRSKVGREMRRETWRLRQSITQSLGPTAVGAPATVAMMTQAPPTIEGMNQRLDQALAILRLSHLEQIRVDLGGTEARQLAVRIAAPFITIAWNQRERIMDLVNKAIVFLQNFALR
jgi:hypothetical protein